MTSEELEAASLCFCGQPYGAGHTHDVTEREWWQAEVARLRAALDGATKSWGAETVRADLAEDRAAKAEAASRLKMREDMDALLEWKARAEAAEAKLAEAERERDVLRALMTGVDEAAAAEFYRKHDRDPEFYAQFKAAERARVVARTAEICAKTQRNALAKALDRTADVLDVAATFAEETRHLHYESGNVDGERVASAVAKECRAEEATVRAARGEIGRKHT